MLRRVWVWMLVLCLTVPADAVGYANQQPGPGSNADYCGRLTEAFARDRLDVNAPLNPSELHRMLGFFPDVEPWPATPLFVAVHFGCIEAVKTLVERGVMST